MVPPTSRTLTVRCWAAALLATASAGPTADMAERFPVVLTGAAAALAPFRPGSSMENMLVPTVGTECEVLVMVPGCCRLLSRWVLPALFGPRHSTLMSESEFLFY